MFKACFAAAALASAVQAFGQPAPGIYKVVSFNLQVDGQQVPDYFGAAPNGYIALTKSHFISLLTAQDRKPGRSLEQKGALLDTLIAYAGPYRVQGDKFIVDVDTSWIQAWNGKPQSRTWSMSGNRLTLVSDPAPYTRDPSKTSIATVTFEKVD